MTSSPLLRAELSQRLRENTMPEWREFANLWIAFNALYGGEADTRERARVMGAVRRHVSRPDALAILATAQRSVDRLVELAPGDMRRDSWDPKFRAASRRCARMYHSHSETVQGRLAGVAGVLYQVRCNLFHGAKDPSRVRDCMLVLESVLVLRELLPALEARFGNKQLTRAV